ncbi:MAG TPA: hypothetical protein ENJ51_00685 [Leucothrix mucor]|uniref:Uncharacterized protein n=1 Tax=Leucothrix mucor TaxID=45248 RepID=A0A7V2SXN3_LEUMU|nr:hypothetical protein [Leucothrix mucor]
MQDIRLPILKTIALTLIGLAVFLFFISLFEPVFITEDKPVKGYWIFAMGWMGFAIFQFAWYANLLSLLAVLLMFKHPVRAFLLSLFSLLLAAESFLFDEIPLGSGKASIAIIDNNIGLYLWIGAHCAVLYAAVLMLIRKKMIDHDLAAQKLKRKPPERIKINSKL